MALRDERKEQNQASKSFFREGVRSVRLSSQKTASVFRMLPAFNPEIQDPSQSWVPCVDPDGQPTDWGKYIYVSSFLGHGAQKRDIVSPRTFNSEAPCPLEDLAQQISSDKAVWEYMVKEDEAKGQRKCFQRPSSLLVINCIDMNQSHLGVVLGYLSKSAGNALVDMCSVRNTNPALVALAAQQGYLIGFANGDITDPRAGMLLTCGVSQVQKKGAFSEYVVAPLMVEDPVTRAKNTRSAPLTPDLLAVRYRLTQPETYIEAKSYEDIVRDLVAIYNKRSPTGIHEYHLLRAAFADYTSIIPEPPPAPGATSTVGGWQGAPVGAPGGFAPSAGGFTPPTGGFAPSAGGFTPPTGSFTPTAGGFSPAPGQGVGGFPGAGGFAPSQSLTPPPAPVTPPTQPVSGEKAFLQQQAAGLGMTTVPATSAPAPVAPGDAIPPYQAPAGAGAPTSMTELLGQIKKNTAAAGQS